MVNWCTFADESQICVNKNLIKIATCQSESNWFECSCFLPRNSRIKWYSNGICTNEMSFNLNLFVRCSGYDNEIHLNRFTLWRNLFWTLHLFWMLVPLDKGNWLKRAMCQAITSILHLTPPSWEDSFPANYSTFICTWNDFYWRLFHTSTQYFEWNRADQYERKFTKILPMCHLH